MTLDEAIAHEKIDSEHCSILCTHATNINDCIECRAYHKQVYEWLKELKELREAEDKFKRNINFFNEINIKVRNQAIDDFKSEVKDLINNSTVIRYKDVDEIAEQLKVGGDNVRL